MLRRVLSGADLSSGWVRAGRVLPYAVAQVDVILVRTVLFETSPQRGALERALTARVRATDQQAASGRAAQDIQISNIGATHAPFRLCRIGKIDGQSLPERGESGLYLIQS